MDLEPTTYSVSGLGQDEPQKVDASGYKIQILFDQDDYLNEVTWFGETGEDWRFGIIGAKVGSEHLKSELSSFKDGNYEHIWDIDLIQDIEHEIGHATFAIMRKLFDVWTVDGNKKDHILEEYYMQIYSDLLSQFRDHIRMLTYDC